MNRKEISKKFQDIRNEHPGVSGLSLYWIFLSRMVSYVVRLVAAKYYLRNCKTGKLVSTRGKPLIIAKGEITIGDRVVIWSLFDRTKLSVRTGGKLVIGDGSRLNGVHIAVKDYVEIGKNVRIAPYTLIMDSDFHAVDEHDVDGKRAPVIIHDDVWLASKCSILKGVTIGQGAVVATGAVVTKDVPPYTVVAGVPARVIQHLRPTSEQHKTLN